VTTQSGFCLGAFLGLLIAAVPAQAHTGPPFAIVSNRASGPYIVSVWTDPDSTDDGSAGGRFWVTLKSSSGPLPADTLVQVTITPLDRAGEPLTLRADPVAGDPSNRLAALVMDHEGRFHVRATIDGPLGRAEVEAEVEATYDERPPPAMIAIYLLPFVLVGFLWVKLLLRRRRRE
jgi:hypothetical protein